MAEITRERQGQMVRKVFEVLMRHPDGLPAREVIAAVERLDLEARVGPRIALGSAHRVVSRAAAAGRDGEGEKGETEHETAEE